MQDKLEPDLQQQAVDIIQKNSGNRAFELLETG